MSKQIEITKPEATLLTIIIASSLYELEKSYKKHKDRAGFLVEDPLSEMNLLKGLLKKIENV